MLLDDDCHSMDSVEVGLICWNELHVNHARVGEVQMVCIWSTT